MHPFGIDRYRLSVMQDFREAITETPPEPEKPKVYPEIRCKAITKSGNRCKRPAVAKYGDYCTILGKLNEKSN